MQVTVERILAALLIFIFLIDEYANIDKTMMKDITLSHSASEHGVNFKILHKGQTQNVKLVKKELVIVYRWMLKMSKQHSNLIKDLELGKNVEDLLRSLYCAVKFP